MPGRSPRSSRRKLLKKGDETLRVANEEQSKTILADLERVTWTVASVATKERKRNAAPPFITSKLQQTARFPVKKTMMLAQQLYEGMELPGLGVDGPIGLITYMRTDSVRVSEEALSAVREHITTTFGADYLPEKANNFKAKADAQDAHEAIRPTSMQYDPETVRPFLTQDQYSLYRLIWNRFVASQMMPATFDETTVDVSAGDYIFRVKGTVPKFAGWMATYGLTPGEQPESEKAEADEDGVSGVLPALAQGDVLELKTIRPEQKFTQPPPRFSEATLVKELEENGIGRPSTYASIIGVLQDRDYVNKLEGRFKPSALGRIISDLLSKSFDDIIDVEYTRSLEEDPRQDRAGQKRIRQDARELLQEVQEGSDARRQGNGRPEKGHRDRRSLRQVRVADAEAGRQVRPLHRLQRLSGLHEHARARDERAGIGNGRG